MGDNYEHETDRRPVGVRDHANDVAPHAHRGVHILSNKNGSVGIAQGAKNIMCGFCGNIVS